MSGENPTPIESFNPEVHDSAEIAATHLLVRQWQESEGRNTFSDILDSQVDLTTIEDTYIAPGGNFFVARQPVTDEIIGFVALRNDGDGQGTLKRLAVVPDQQGQRIGPALVAELIDWARAHGFVHLTLTTGKDELAREKVYEHAGFAVTGEIPEHDDWVMELDLEPPYEQTSEFLASICQEVLSEEDCADLLALPFDEALGYAYTLLIESGEVEDPTTFFVEKGLLE